MRKSSHREEKKKTKNAARRSRGIETKIILLISRESERRILYTHEHQVHALIFLILNASLRGRAQG